MIYAYYVCLLGINENVIEKKTKCFILECA